MTREASSPGSRRWRAELRRVRERLRVVRCSVLLSTIVLVCACSPDQPMAGSSDGAASARSVDAAATSPVPESVVPTSGPTPTSPTPASSSAPTPLTTSVTTTLLPALPIVHPQPPGCGPEISLLLDGLYWESEGAPPTLDYAGVVERLSPSSLRYIDNNGAVVEFHVEPAGEGDAPTCS